MYEYIYERESVREKQRENVRIRRKPEERVCEKEKIMGVRKIE